MAERKLPGSFRLQLLALLLAFLGALGLLAQAYGRSALLSQKAEQLNLSVGLARNGAEAFAGCGSLEEAALLLGGQTQGEDLALVFFDGAGQSCAPEGTAYRMEMEQTPQEREEGWLYTCEIRVYRAEDDRELYALTTARYRPGGEGGGL